MARFGGQFIHLNNYHFFSNENGCLYRVQLQNEYKQVLALSSEMNKEDADTLQSKIISLSLRNALLWKKAEERKGYSIKLQTEEGMDLFGKAFSHFNQGRMPCRPWWTGLSIIQRKAFSGDHDNNKGYQ